MAEQVGAKRPSRIVVHAVGARPGAGAGYNRVLKMARTFPALSPGDRFLFVVRPELADEVRSISRELSVISPPPRLPNWCRVLWERSVLPLRLRRWRPDVVFGAYNLFPGWLGARGTGRVLMVTNLLPFAEVRKEYRGLNRLSLEALRHLTRHSIRRADLVLLLAPHAVDLIGPSLVDGKCVMLPPALPADPPQKSAPIQGVGARFVVVADLNRLKSIETVIRAVPLVGVEGLSVRIFGRTSDPSYARLLEAEIDRLGVGGSVRLEGMAPHSRVLEEMCAGDACIAPSRFENLSHVLLEALSVGAPLIASDIPGAREVCGDAALYFVPGDHRSLATLMRRVATDETLRRTLSDMARIRCSTFEASDQSSVIIDALRGVILTGESVTDPTDGP